jgi:hypothetical protein
MPEVTIHAFFYLRINGVGVWKRGIRHSPLADEAMSIGGDEEKCKCALR